MIEILTSGLMNSVQDLGRPGFLDQGIGRGGMMDRTALRVGNLLVGNDEGAAGLEISIFPFRIRFVETSFFAVTGAGAIATLNGVPLPPWWAHAANAGDELRIEPPDRGARVVLAFSGGLDVPLVLGSRSTDLKSGFGGLEGRALKRGDRLAVRSAGPVKSNHRQGCGADPAMFRDAGATQLRVMTGAEFSAFAPEAAVAFFSERYTVSRDNNRQGMRLDGAALALTQKLELHSHGIMPGTVQVPPSGQPVIQLAEANTCGGYPKIAHVIEPDHWKLAQASSGTQFSFVEVSREQAVAAIRNEELQIRRLRNLMPLVAARKAS
ncbi:MAG: allophanate hydrolase [Rhizobium sp.]|nr:allophanate hydrolase [Rhizobium sp.]